MYFANIIDAVPNTDVERRRQQIESISLKSIREEERAEEAARVAAEQKPIDDALASINDNMLKLRDAQRDKIFDLPDLDFRADPDAPQVLFGNPLLQLTPEQERDDLVRKEVKKFMQANPDYWPCAENLDTITRYLDAQRVNFPTAMTLGAAFRKLSDLGLMLQKPVPVAAPAVPAPRAAAAPQRPTSWDVNEYPFFQNSGGKASDLITGYDPHGSGTRVTLTRGAVEKMDLDDFKRFGRPTVQAKPDWARIDDREMSGAELSALQVFSPSGSLRGRG